ncbi:MAG TPA: orotidine-5'-phosphate decarboxylase [Rhodothermales bacterium]|nr:orotidine-5'-phosphate decarboxylase [Rhodothermales bacterium]
MAVSFTERLRRIQSKKSSSLCIGLDPDPDLLPKHLSARQALPEAILAFNSAIIEATRHTACAFKVNFAFYEVLGTEGWRVLYETVQMLPEDVLIIADAKRGDIGNSARFYARATFEELGCDAITVTPYMGRDSIEPFLQYEGKAAFILARTSNPGASDFQEQQIHDKPLYRLVAESVARWDHHAKGTAGLVVGATSSDALDALRQICPTLPFLIPGVGAQGGDADTVMRSAATPDGPVLVNSSRAILYASAGEDFAQAAAREAERLRDTMERARHPR